MKIIKLIIKNFESHKETVINFSKGVNCIVGESDTGKSGILRALYWVLSNTAFGDFSNGRKTSVEIVVDHNGEIISVIREKTPTINQYKLIKEGKAPILFKTIYSSVPEEIQKIFNINEVNIQEQADMPFLLDSSPGEVGRRLNEIANLSLIDELQKRLKSQISDAKNKYENAKEVLSNNKKELEKYEWLDNAEKDINVLYGINKNIEESDKEIGVLIYSIDKIKENQTDLDSVNWVETAISEFDILLNYYNNYQTLFPSVTKMSETVENIIDTNKQIDSLQYVNELENEINNLYELHNNVSILQTDFDKIKSLLDQIFIIDKELDNISEVIILEKDINEAERLLILAREAEKEYKMLEMFINDIMKISKSIEVEKQDIKEIETQFPDICPLCGNALSKGKEK